MFSHFWIKEMMVDKEVKKQWKVALCRASAMWKITFSLMENMCDWIFLPSYTPLLTEVSKNAFRVFSHTNIRHKKYWEIRLHNYLSPTVFFFLENIFFISVSKATTNFKMPIGIHGFSHSLLHCVWYFRALVDILRISHTAQEKQFISLAK